MKTIEQINKALKSIKEDCPNIYNNAILRVDEDLRQENINRKDITTDEYNKRLYNYVKHLDCN